MATAKDIFDKRIPDSLAKHGDKARAIGSIYCFKISGGGGGTWTVDLASNPPTCTSGDSGKAQCTVELSDTDFEQLLVNPQLGMQLYFQGKLKITGDPTLAMRLQKLFELAK